MNTAGRNDPCPCGSGKKYKKCCLPREEAAAKDKPKPVAEPAEEPFTAVINPEVDEEADLLLSRLERGDDQGLEEDLKKLLARHPNYHTTNYAMGAYLAHAKKDPQGAIPFLEKAVRIFPIMVEAHFNLGLAHTRLGHIGKGVAAYRKAIHHSDGADGIDKMAQQMLNELEMIIQRTSPFSTLEAYIENETLFDQAFEQLRKKRYQRAVEGFSKVLEQNPEHVQSHGNMALALAALGQKASALASLDRALELDPTYGLARMNRIAIARMTEGQPFIPSDIRETEYYREQMEAEKAKPKSFWHQLLFWKSRK